MYGREPESVFKYLKKHLVNESLKDLFRVVNTYKYQHWLWCEL